MILLAVIMSFGSFESVFAAENPSLNGDNSTKTENKAVVQKETATTTARPIQDQAVTFTVTFSVGNNKTVVTVDENQCVPKPSDPKPPMKHAHFKYWADEEGNEFDFNTPITKDRILEAVFSLDEWPPIPESPYNITFNSNGGSKVKEQVIKRGAIIKKPQDPTKSGYYFWGWYTKDGKKWDFSKSPTGDMTLYAHWGKYDKSPQTSDPGFPLLPLLLLCGASAVGLILVRRQRP